MNNVFSIINVFFHWQASDIFGQEVQEGITFRFETDGYIIITTLLGLFFFS